MTSAYSPRLPEPGQVLLGKYQLRRLLGRGGVGVVFEAEHLRLRQRVAVKFLAPEMAEHADMVERFEREARAMALMSSPYVTRVIDVDATEERVPFLVMEYLQGHDLQQELKLRGALTVPEAAHWVREACAGMAVAHAAGIVHRDLKPANLFLVDEPNARTLKIMDFGISKITGEDLDVTMTTTSLGTPAYMSPEQVKSAKHIDGRADVWSLGVILYRALSGRLPFRGSGTTGMAVSIVNDEPEPIESIMPDLPVGLAAIVRKTLEKSPEARFATVGALADALAAFEHGALAAPPPAPGVAQADGGSLASHVQTNTTVRVSSRRGPLIAGGLALVAVAALAGFFVVRTVSRNAAGANEPKGIEGSPDPQEPAARKPRKPAVDEAPPEPTSVAPAPSPTSDEPAAPSPTPESAAPAAGPAGSPPAARASASASASVQLPKPLVGPPAASGPSGPTALPKADPKPAATTPLPVLL